MQPPGVVRRVSDSINLEAKLAGSLGSRRAAVGHNRRRCVMLCPGAMAVGWGLLVSKGRRGSSWWLERLIANVQEVGFALAARRLVGGVRPAGGASLPAAMRQGLFSNHARRPPTTTFPVLFHCTSKTARGLL